MSGEILCHVRAFLARGLPLLTQVLGLEKLEWLATDEDIKTAYRRLVVETHPRRTRACSVCWGSMPTCGVVMQSAAHSLLFFHYSHCFGVFPRPKS